MSSTPRTGIMAIIAMALILIISALLITPASASTASIISDERLHEPWFDTSGNGTQYSSDNWGSGYQELRNLGFKNIENHQLLSYIVIDTPKSLGQWDNGSRMAEGRYDLTYIYDGITKPAVVYISRPIFGGTKITIFLNDWDIGNKKGSQIVTLPGWRFTKSDTARDGISQPPVYMVGNPKMVNAKITWVSATEWYTDVLISEDDVGYDIRVNRTVNGVPYETNVTISGPSGLLDSEKSVGGVTEWWYPKTDGPYSLIINHTAGTAKEYRFGAEDPTPPTDPADPDGSGITVYIKNSQTGALIANANVVIDALVDGEYYPLANRTEPSGIFTINLQPTGGGQPNPDGYRLMVTADGYYNPTPVINFTVDAYTKLSTYLYLDPIAGGPADENKTFIDFFVRDMSSNPISGATVKFGKYTLITNSAGYAVFEVDKNNTYSWTISKSGYGALTGNAVIGNDPRHTINTVLAPIVTPTITTPIPTSPPIGPTPTMTAPTGEPVSNWLEWFAAHFGMILGGGVEIGKIFMWLCFTVPVGVYVGKESKAGAAGFMAGAGIVTLFFVLIGWVPIWLVVLLALIIGLLYAKVFNAQDNGGGR